MANVLKVCPDARTCSWTEHGRRHFPHRGMTKGHTRHRPAKYLPGTTSPQIRAIETATVQTPGTPSTQSHNEYLRDVGQIIGWDLGKDAMLSFAECSGGDDSGRAFHGRPMSDDNSKAKP